jgi:hypothetical protein
LDFNGYRYLDSDIFGYRYRYGFFLTDADMDTVWNLEPDTDADTDNYSEPDTDATTDNYPDPEDLKFRISMTLKYI